MIEFELALAARDVDSANRQLGAIVATSETLYFHDVHKLISMLAQAADFSDTAAAELIASIRIAIAALDVELETWSASIITESPL